MPLAPGTQIGRYRVLLRLGEGGMGEVYRARDLTLGRDVALKIISGEASHEPAALQRFIQEAQAASALNHPNIVSVFDIGECEAGPFIVMEVVEGYTLRSVMRSGPRIDLLIDLGRQVARALSVAHAAGIVHRDIKPENLLVRGDGYVKVVDFGLARIEAGPLDSERVTSEESIGAAPTVGRGGDSIMGTVAYMSPERVRGDEAGSETDIFSLGLIFYELATGHHPFSESSGASLLARLLSEHPVAASHLNPELPPSLDALISRMIEKDARIRPDAAEVDRVIATLAEIVSERIAPSRSALPPRHTVGHDAARSELAGAFERAAAGRGQLVAVSGEAGIGKTTLVEEYLADLMASGQRCLIARGRCSERLAEAGAYLPWLEALETMRDESGGSVRRVMKTLAPTWHARIAPLAADDSHESRLATVNRGGSQEFMNRELVTFLDEVARHRPLVVFLDDVHWADLSTVDLIAYLGSRLQSMRVLLIVTYRPADLLLRHHPFHSVKLDLQSRGIAHELGVPFLSERDVERYLDLEFPGHQFPKTFAALVHVKTEGNPLFMADLLRSLRDRQVLREDAGHWTLTQEASAFEREIPESIRSMIELKIAHLDEYDRRLLAGASVQGVEFDSAIVSRALTLDQADVEDRLAALERIHGLVQQVRELELPDRSITSRYRFVHALYHDALHASLGPSRRASWSAAVARALIATHLEQAPALASELALLFEAARDFPRAAEFFLAASERARQVFAYREALTLAERGMAMLLAVPDTPERAPREVMHLMAIALSTGPVKGFGAPELEQAYKRARLLFDQLGGNPQFFAVVAGIAAFQFMRAEIEAASKTDDEMLRLSASAGSPVMTIWSDWSYGSLLAHRGDRLPEARARLETGVNLYDPSMHPAFMVMTSFDPGVGCHFQLARVLLMLGLPEESIAQSARAVALARSLGHPLMILFSLFFEAWIRQLRREPEAVLDATAEALRINEQYGYGHIGAWVQVMHGWALGVTGDPARGERLVRDAIAQCDTMGLALMRPNFLALLAETVALQGRGEEALRIVTEAEAIAERTGELYYSAELQRLKGQLSKGNS